MSGKTVAIIGAGPAGLTAAYLLCKEGVPVTVIEADPELVGGIARTASYKGYHFDIGGHRFFSKSKEVEDLWTELLPGDLLERPRSSRSSVRTWRIDSSSSAISTRRMHTVYAVSRGAHASARGCFLGRGPQLRQTMTIS